MTPQISAFPVPLSCPDGSQVDNMVTLLPNVHENDLPTQFTYPFHYQPHPIALQACHELQQELMGLHASTLQTEPGKMFGVLIVKLPANHTAENSCTTTEPTSTIGYLKAYSGTLKAPLPGFCRLIYNRLAPTSAGEFSYSDGENELNQLTAQIEELVTNPQRIAWQDQLETMQQQAAQEIQAAQQQLKENKRDRKIVRQNQVQELPAEAFEALEERLRQESAADQRRVKALKQHWEECLANHQTKLDEKYNTPLQNLQEQRTSKSNWLTQQLFEHYQFLNIRKESANLLDVFPSDTPPPGGAGDCAAPKLLQHAFLRGYHPVALAEFWWGSDANGLRKHGFYYPACRGKCHPILVNHMLKGLDVEPNPLETLGEDADVNFSKIQTVYEDEYILVVDKPADVLSVPGRLLQSSVLTHMRQRYPHATGPLLVHRLDMSTSGLLLIALDKDIHKHLSQQFIDRTVQKRYESLLEGVVDKADLTTTTNRETKRGKIDLPIMSDYYHRPMQKVDYEHGKPAVTYYQILGIEAAKCDDHQHKSQCPKKKRTRVYFWPHTGRTHQLRVHAAHEQGLNLPMVGDDIYGQRKEGERLCLHAGWLQITHPITGKRMTFTYPAPF